MAQRYEGARFATSISVHDDALVRASVRHLFGSTVTDFASNPVSINAVGHVAVRASLADGRQLILRTNPGD